MDLGLQGKSALLVGAGRGIGAATALSLAREGCKVALVARTPAALESTAAACRAAGAPVVAAIAADATSPDELKNAVGRAADELGGLSILINLVGGSQPGGAAETNDAGWAAAFERNLWPAVRATRLALPHLERAAAGRDERCQSVVVHVASIWGREGGGAPTYNAAKAALISLAHAQARELAPRGVRVLSVAPGSTLHPGGSWERRLREDPVRTRALVERELPAGRFGSAEEQGDVLAFLCSRRASWVSGTCVVVDGGQSRSF